MESQSGSTARLKAAWVTLGIAGVLAGCSRNPAADPHAVTRAEVQARNAIAVQAIEPKSLVFRNERVVFRDGAPTVCGEFNGRNRKGEYAGFTRYLVHGDETAIEDRHQAFRDRWAQMCEGG